MTHGVGEPRRPRAGIPPGEPERVQELVRRELANLLSLRDREAELRERAKRRDDLLRMRRRLRASIATREAELRADKCELAEVERELSVIRLPPGLKASA
jgi:predicted Zn-dependent peptidase